MKNQNPFNRVLIAALIAVLLIGGTSLHAQESGPIKQHPAYLPLDQYVDLKLAEPTVNVNLPKFLLNNMLSELGEGGDDPFGEVGIQIKDLVKDIKLIQVMLFELEGSRSGSIQKSLKSGIDKLQGYMGDNWIPIVKVPEENVGIYAMGDESGERMIGLAMTVIQDEIVVVGNLVGEISIGKIVKLGTSVYSVREGGHGGPNPMEAIFRMLGVAPPGQGHGHHSDGAHGEAAHEDSHAVSAEDSVAEEAAAE